MIRVRDDHSPDPSADGRHRRPLRTLRWRCDPAVLPFETTDEVAPATMRMSQGPAYEALRFAICCDARDQNVFVRGLIDTRRERLIFDALDDLRPAADPHPDYVYVRNFAEPHRPHLLALEAGTGARFQHAMRSFALYIRELCDEDDVDDDGPPKPRKDLRPLIEARAAEVRKEFHEAVIEQYLAAVVEDACEERPGSSHDPVVLYGANLVSPAIPLTSRRPVVVELDPTPEKLLGTFVGNSTQGRDDHMRIRAGAIIHANGGYLVLDAGDLASIEGAWHAILETLRSGEVEISTPDSCAAAVRPDPIPVRVRVILVGDPNDYEDLDRLGPDFAHHFKVLVDVDHVIDRDEHGFAAYAGTIARLGRGERLLPFHRSAIAALVEHGARIAGRGGKLTGRLARIADVAREAEYLTRQRRDRRVMGTDVYDAIRRTKQRADLDSRRFLEYVREGAILIEVRGGVVGQINGLAVIHAGPLTYGFPARITASVGAGSSGVVDIEGLAELSGAIHTKGFQILVGLLRRLIETDHPLAFSASLASEQSYGRVDGDSSSAAELFALLSALTGVPIRQGLAVTGAIDQRGQIQAVGSVDEKIEGFFDVCALLGLDGAQGVVIPRSNAGDLMLRDDVVEACEQGRFHVYGVDTIHEALELLTDVPCPPAGRDGRYPAGSFLALAVDRSREFWRNSMRKPKRPWRQGRRPRVESRS
jgi:predicted ATP-dependent protease